MKFKGLSPSAKYYAFNFEYHHKYFKAVYASTKSLRMRKMAQNNYVPVTFLCKLSHNVNYKNSREGRQHVQKLYTEYHNPAFWSRQTQWSENDT